MNQKKEQEALFWGNILYSAIFRDPEDIRSVRQILLDIASREVKFPDGTERKPSLSTLKRKLKAYREGKLKGLTRKIRNDKGKIKAVNEKLLNYAESLKRELPERTARMINVILKARKGCEISRSTLYRHLAKRGATRVKLGLSSKKVRKRWSRNHTHSIWVGDFSCGPDIITEGEVRPSQLSAFIDAHSRFIVAGIYACHANFETLMETLLRGWAKHGKSKAIYVDNAKTYHSPRLRAACLDLEIELLHRPVRDPAAGGIIEIFFKTCQRQFELEVRKQPAPLTLIALNNYFEAWLEQVYHKSVNSETNQTPLARYSTGLKSGLRLISMDKAREYFMKRFERRVNKDFSDVSVNSVLYRLPSKYRGDKVQVWIDPYSDQSKALIYSLDGNFLTEAYQHERKEGEVPNKIVEKKHDDGVLKTLLEAHRQDQKILSKQQFKSTNSSDAWSFGYFVKRMGELVGFDLSSLGEHELDELKRVYHKWPTMSEKLLQKAWKRANDKKTIGVLKEITRIFKENESC